MQQLSPSDLNPFRHLLGRLSRVFAEINVALLAITIGLAVLDLTCFVTLSASVEITRARAEVSLRAPAGALERSRPPIPESIEAGFSDR
jgi:hypothetical protein